MREGLGERGVLLWQRNRTIRSHKKDGANKRDTETLGEKQTAQPTYDHLFSFSFGPFQAIPIEVPIGQYSLELIILPR